MIYTGMLTRFNKKKIEVDTDGEKKVFGGKTVADWLEKRIENKDIISGLLVKITTWDNYVIEVSVLV